MSDSEGKSEEIVVDSSSITFSSVGDSGPQEGVRIDLESDSSIEWNDDESSAENWFEDDGRVVDVVELKRELVEKREEGRKLIAVLRKIAGFCSHPQEKKVNGIVYYRMPEGRGDQDLGRVKKLWENVVVGKLEELNRVVGAYNSIVASLSWAGVVEGVGEKMKGLSLKELGVTRVSVPLRADVSVSSSSSISPPSSAPSRPVGAEAAVAITSPPPFLSPSSISSSSSSSTSSNPSVESIVGALLSAKGALTIQKPFKVKGLPFLSKTKITPEEWLDFQSSFVSKMSVARVGEEEMLQHLSNTLNTNLAQYLECHKKGLVTGSIESCMLVLKEKLLGPKWLEKFEEIYHQRVIQREDESCFDFQMRY